MTGTIVNTATIIIGAVIGAILHRGIQEKYKQMLYTGLGLASLAIGLNATISHFSESEYPVLFIISIAVGGIIGTAIDIDSRFKRLIDKYSKNGNGNRLADGLATAILLYCIGPLSMLGPVISALKGDHTFLFHFSEDLHICPVSGILEMYVVQYPFGIDIYIRIGIIFAFIVPLRGSD